MNSIRLATFFVLVCFACKLSLSDATLKIISCDRLIDISSQIVKVTNKISIQNAGPDTVSSFIFTLDPAFLDNVAVIKGRVSDTDIALSISPTSFQGAKAWSVKFDQPVEGGKSALVDVYYALIDYLKPYPTRISQKDKQFIKFAGNGYLYSPYAVSKVITSVALGTKNVESYTHPVEPVSFSDSHILYGPYKDLAPFSQHQIEIHYENNSPFLIASELIRHIEISHWGNIAVEEEITLEHTGAKLKGPFSRYDYQREADSGLSSVKSFKTLLPATATDIYYRDEIGNISTSHLYFQENSVQVELRPRFPLFGGWNTRYILGYNVPSYTYLYAKGDNYLLKMPLVDHIFDNMVVKEATIRIVLPEGSHSIDLNLPYEATRLPDSLHYTYLDTIGRPVITIRKTNLVEDHIEPFELRYVFPKMFMLLEPLLIIGFLYLLFLTVVVYVRLDFSLSKDEDVEQKLRLSGACSRLVNYHERRMKLYQHFEEKLNATKYSKDVSSFNVAVKAFNNEYKNVCTQISEFSAKLKSESAEVYEKALELAKVDKSLKDLYTQHQLVYSEKLIPGKISKQAFVDTESNFQKKKDELVGKINKLVKNIE